MTLNPRDYASFEDYLEALRVSEAFGERVEQVSDVLSQDKSVEEEREEMKKLWFDWHDDGEDELCGREFCTRHDACLSIILDEIEYSANSILFEDMLLDEHKLLEKKPWELFVHCDDLPPIWFETWSSENRTIEAYMQIQDLVSEYGYSQGKSYNDIISSKVVIWEFLEDLYFWLHAVLRNDSSWRSEKYKKSLLKKLQSQIFGLEITPQMRKSLS